MKIVYFIFLVMVMTGTACNKTDENEIGHSSITGTWKMTEFIVHQADGTIQWQAAYPLQPEEITFYASGGFSSNQNFIWRDQGYDKYRITDSSHIELSSVSTSSTATFYYKLESADQLLFNPVCRESCSRRYVAVK